jgi:hypothetical protein
MAKQTLRYEIVLAHAGRRDDTIIETVEATSRKAYDALMDRTFKMNCNLTTEERATKTYYGVRAAS